MTRPVDSPALGPVLCACPRCRRQWDATGMPVDARLRCTCGEVFGVPAERARAPRVFRCDQCGAALPAEGRTCAYCSAEVTLEERGLSGVCPGCSARLSANARFCMECGLAIQPQRLTALREGVACPRCKAALRVRELGARSAIECSSCAGLWLAPAFFEELCRRAEKEGLVEAALEGPPGTEATTCTAPANYIPCITCGELMLRKNFGECSGVVIDVCKHHGVWLDHRELGRILAFVQKGGLVRARERQVARLEREAERRDRSALPPTPPGGGTGGARDLWEDQDDLLDGLACLGRSLARWLR
ncbi:MAG: zinc ribbon domain-containing protein [Planctomycetes bacterium]|nr:zinc ribbon domain-containing protein [Planctomycetota bacterium]